MQSHETHVHLYMATEHLPTMSAFHIFRRVMWSSALISSLQIVSGYFWYLSLSRTNVPANTAIYQSAAAFTFILSVPILREKVTLVKVSSVFLSVMGVVLIAVYSKPHDGSAVNGSILGYVVHTVLML